MADSATVARGIRKLQYKSNAYGEKLFFADSCAAVAKERRKQQYESGAHDRKTTRR